MSSKYSSTMQRLGLNGMGYAILGAFMFSFGLNIFIIPLSFYNGGFMGISQLIRTFLLEVFHLSFGQTDIAGIIYLILNLPLLYLAWTMGKNFFLRSIVTILLQTAFLTFIPIPVHPIIEDYLTACIIGGIVAGSGSGLILRGGSSGGGQDILGLYYTKKFPGFSVGKMSLIVNILVYGICLAMFDIQIVIYKGGNRPGDYGTDRTGRHKLGRRRFLYQ